MSASISFHGPYKASGRLIRPGEFTREPFVTVDIRSGDVTVSLVNIDATGLEALSAAVGEARVLLESITEPEPDEARRIAEVFDEARAELDRGL